MTTVVVSIGRNVGSTPMVAPQWENFIGRTESAVLDVNGTVYSRARGRGEWDGGSEDTFILIADVAASLVPFLANRLRTLASLYGQDAIGLTVHDDRRGPSFVEAF